MHVCMSSARSRTTAIRKQYPHLVLFCGYFVSVNASTAAATGGSSAMCFSHSLCVLRRQHKSCSMNGQSLST